MNAKTCFAIFVGLIGLCFLSPPRAIADVAPSPEAVASDISPLQGTHVQMVSEHVLLDIGMQSFLRGSSSMRAPAANVTADFIMRNPGAVNETMQVRFPKSFPTSDGSLPVEFGSAIETIITFVDGVPVPNHQVKYGDAPWAVWQVNFPPGRDVHLRVQYRTVGVDYNGSVDFYYILETGAGWRGAIGQGDIVFQFPYAADLEMVAPHDSYIRPEYPSTTPPFIVAGNQLCWHFENLEPTKQDNIRLLIVSPDLWQAVLDARAQVKRKPDDAAAYVQLGQAYRNAVPVKKEWPDGSTFAGRFGTLAEAAFERAVTLAPDEAAVHVAYARFLADHAWSLTPEPYYTRARRELARALELDANASGARAIARELDRLAKIPEIAQEISTSQAAPGLPDGRVLRWSGYARHLDWGIIFEWWRRALLSTVP